MDDWSHGYWSGNAYTDHFHRELAPNWLDFAALLRGHPSPRRQEGVPFRYLELGSGTGYGLCLLAAAYPEGRFLGIDFLPDHCVKGRFLADRLGLGNVEFQDADLLDLARDAPAFRSLLGPASRYEYVVGHGVLSWVRQDVQQALLAVAAKALIPGGLFLCSYNTYPGWLAATSFQRLVRLEAERRPPAEALERAFERFEVLLGDGSNPTPLSAPYPVLRRNLAKLRGQSLDYLLHELANGHWQPLHVAEAHALFREHRLRPVSSAVLPHSFPELLPAAVRTLLEQEQDGSLRETLFDLAINQSFRFDLLARGSLQLGGPPLLQALGAVGLRPGALAGERGGSITTDLAEIPADHPSLSEPLERLAAGACLLGELGSGDPADFRTTLRAVALLLHADRIALDRGLTAQAGRERILAANRALCTLMQEGFPPAHLAAADAGTAVPFSCLESLIQAAMADGLEGGLLVECVGLGIEALGFELRDPEGQPIRKPQARAAAIGRAAEQFRAVRLPLLQSLGALPAGAGR